MHTRHSPTNAPFLALTLILKGPSLGVLRIQVNQIQAQVIRSSSTSMPNQPYRPMCAEGGSFSTGVVIMLMPSVALSTLSEDSASLAPM